MIHILSVHKMGLSTYLQIFEDFMFASWYFKSLWLFFQNKNYASPNKRYVLYNLLFSLAPQTLPRSKEVKKRTSNNLSFYPPNFFSTPRCIFDRKYLDAIEHLKNLDIFNFMYTKLGNWCEWNKFLNQSVTIVCINSASETIYDVTLISIYSIISVTHTIQTVQN